MTSKTLSGIFIGCFVAGLFLAIYLQTGININPDDLMLDMTGRVIEQMPQTHYTTAMWGSFVLIIFLIGLLATLEDGREILAEGKTGIFVAGCGFFGGLLLPGYNISATISVFAAVLLIVGGTVAGVGE